MMKYEDNLERINKIADKKNLTLNIDIKRVEKVVGLMTNSFNEHGAYYCPCKQENETPIRGIDVICPCPELDKEIQATGACHCRLFYQK